MVKNKTKMISSNKGARLARALLLVALLFVLNTSYALADGNVTVTRQFSPSANAAVTSGAGDNNGFQTTPTNAYADGSGSAVDTSSGASDNSDPTGTGTDKHNFYNYGLGVIPSGSTINGITVRADISVDALTDGPFTAIRLSWDGGTSWTAVKQLTLTATAETTYTFGGSSDTWGRTWSTSELTDANFRVQVINGDTRRNRSFRDFSLDWLPVSITFTAPWDSYSDSGRTTVSDNFIVLGATVYMKGTGYIAGTYNVAYYDAGTNGGQKTATESNISVGGDGILNSQYLLNTDPNRVGGTWHALVQPTGGGAFPSYYNDAIATPDAYAILGNDAFQVEQSAIPEFPGAVGAIVVAGACFALYYGMRKRVHRVSGVSRVC